MPSFSDCFAGGRGEGGNHVFVEICEIIKGCPDRLKFTNHTLNRWIVNMIKFMRNCFIPHILIQVQDIETHKDFV